MTIDSLNKRLSRLSDTASPKASIAHSLEMAVERQKARQAEWIAAGNTGPVPPEPWLLELGMPASRQGNGDAGRSLPLDNAKAASDGVEQWQANQKTQARICLHITGRAAGRPAQS